MAFSDTVYSGQMLEGLNRAKLGYMDQDTQRIRDAQTLQAALARVQAMNEQTAAGERSSNREWNTRGRLGDAQNVNSAADIANRGRLGDAQNVNSAADIANRLLLGNAQNVNTAADISSRENMHLAGLQSGDENARLNRIDTASARDDLYKLELDKIREQGMNQLFAAQQNTFGGYGGNRPDQMVAANEDIAASNANHQSVADLANVEIGTPENHSGNQHWWNYFNNSYNYNQNAKDVAKKYLDKYPGSVTFNGGTNAVPVIRPLPLGSQQNKQGPLQMQKMLYTRQYGPMPTTKIPGTAWGPDLIIGSDGMWRSTK